MFFFYQFQPHSLVRQFVPTPYSCNPLQNRNTCLLYAEQSFFFTYSSFKISVIFADCGLPNNSVGTSLRHILISFILGVCQTDFFHNLKQNVSVTKWRQRLQTNVTLIVCKAMDEGVEQQNKAAETHLAILQEGATTQRDTASLLTRTSEPRFSTKIFWEKRYHDIIGIKYT